jgi:hypothetical protein
MDNAEKVIIIAIYRLIYFLGQWYDTVLICLFVESILETRPICTDSALVAAVSSMVIICLMISILMFIGGFISGLYVDRKFYRDSSKGTSQVTAERPHQVPFYDDIILDVANQQEQNLELKENVAYLPSKSTAVQVN